MNLERSTHDPIQGASPDIEDDETTLPQQFVLTKAQLDERAKFFSALLIEEWIRNPGNVRLLRIALDLYPDCYYLEQVLKILRSGWESKSFRKAKREVRIYCLAELFRAGATETGLVQEDECLPAGVSIDEYHKRLIEEAQELVIAYSGRQGSWISVSLVFDAAGFPISGYARRFSGTIGRL